MATYISFVQFTDKEIHDAKETTQRVAHWAAKVQSMGVTIKQMYWTLGHYDQVCVFEEPNDETAASVLLSAGHTGQHSDADATCFYQHRDGEDSREYSLTAAIRNFFARKQGGRYWSIMSEARADRQWSSVGSLRDEAHLYRGLSRASTTTQWAMQ
jgi:uncharacterized protein with GYD domain